MNLFLCLILFTTLLKITISQILAIDFGTEFIKSAVVNSGTGKSFSIVHNSKSQRKILNAIGFYSEERLYEQESLPKRPKIPTNCFIYTKLLVDSINDKAVLAKIKKDLLLEYIRQSDSDPLMSTFILQNFSQENNEVTLIQVMGMILKHAKVNAQNQIQTQIKDVILTVPNHWTLKMREFIVEAAQIADLYILSLISQNTGAAINYALNQRSKNSTQKILFFNLGSSSLQMTIAEFKQVSQEKGKPIQSVFILGDYGKSYVGGLRFDTIIYQYFLKKFEKKYQKKLSQRGKIKLISQANKVKEVLSANKEGMIFVQGLMDGIDFMEKITRSEFQEMSKELLREIVSPIKSFLFEYDLKIEDIDGVQLIGGSIRIPKIQDMIGDIIKEKEKIGKHINGDQAMVLGAAFYGANSSKKFKVKGIHLYDGFNFEIRAVIKNLNEQILEEDQRYILKNVTIFKQKSRFGITKEINFRSNQNIIVQLYKEDTTGLELLRKSKFDTIQQVNETNFKISLTLTLDPLKIVFIKTSQITYKKDEIQTYVEKVKKLNDKDDQKIEKSEKSQKSKSQKREENNEDKISEQNKEQQNEQENAEGGKKMKKKKKEEEYQTVERNKTVTKKYQKQLKKEELYSFQKNNEERNDKSKRMLHNYQKIQEKKRKLLQKKNKLQSLIYQGRQKLENSQFIEFTKESQREKVENIIKEKSQWLDYTGSQDHEQYENHLKVLKKPLERIYKRINEYNNRELSKKQALKSLEEYQNLTKKIREKKQWITEEERDVFLKSIEQRKEQINEMMEKMLETQKNQNPIYLTKDFTKIVEKVKDQYFKLMSTPKPKKEKKKEESTQKSESHSQDEL